VEEDEDKHDEKLAGSEAPKQKRTRALSSQALRNLEQGGDEASIYASHPPQNEPNTINR
jgi:hypothetical protein